MTSSSPSTTETGWIAPPAIFGPGTHARVTADLPTQCASMAEGRGFRSPKRLREFSAGRRCAARALRDAGSGEVDVGVGASREPLWPSGFVGSITHSPSRACAAVAATTRLRGIGVDFEPIFDADAMSEAVPLALTDRERHLGVGMSEREVATLVFSAKESLYKCLHPLVHAFFEFHDAEMTWIAPSGRFRVRLLRDLGLEFSRGSELEGRYLIADGHVHTALELAR